MNQSKYISLSPLFLDVRGRILCRKNCVALDEYCLSFFEQINNCGRIWKIEMTSTVTCLKIPKYKGRLTSRGLNWHWAHLQPNDFKTNNSVKSFHFLLRFFFILNQNSTLHPHIYPLTTYLSFTRCLTTTPISNSLIHPPTIHTPIHSPIHHSSILSPTCHPVQIHTPAHQLSNYILTIWPSTTTHPSLLLSPST